jgi:poly(rC)-binding protein 3/4
MRDVGDMTSMPEIPGAASRGLGAFAGFVSSLTSISIYISINTTGDIVFNLMNCLSKSVQPSVMPNLTAEVLVQRLVIPALSGEDGGCLDGIH